MEVVLHYYPLTREFIDWVVKEGFKVWYPSDWKAGTGAVWWSLKRIVVSPQGEKRLVDQTLVHELVHIAIPGLPPRSGSMREQEKYEEAIDEIADVYLSDLGLMEYIKEKETIPIFQGGKGPD